MCCDPLTTQIVGPLLGTVLSTGSGESKNASIVTPLVIAGVLTLVAGPLAGLLYLGTKSCES